MQSSFVNPGLFLAGLAAVLLPILIHLLNKRRFKRVDWAAMDFLLQAEKINKRRIRLEEFLLLLMRCAIMVLLGLLLARPFFTFDSAAGFLKGARHERIIVLDDSMSMKARSSGSSPLVESQKTITKWINALAANNPGDSVSLLVTSRPERPLYRDEPLTEGSLTRLLDDVKGIEASDEPTHLAETLDAVGEMLQADEGTSINRIVYVLTDFRKRDWASAGQDEVKAKLEALAEKAAGCYLIDMGKGGGTDNLVVEAVLPQDKTLIAGVASRFDVVVRNHGSAAATDVKVRLTADDALPLERVIDRISPGETGTAPFTYTFARPPDGGAPPPVRLQAEVVPETGDLLADDNVRYFPARVTEGLPVLLVDGDPSGIYGESDTFFLQKALAPRGPAISGMDVTVMDETDFEGVDLDAYHVIYLVNLYRISESRRVALERWVSEGGGLVWVLGNQVDEESYNAELFTEAGESLLPLRLQEIEGDATLESWAFLDPRRTNHQVLQLFEGDASPLLQGVKIFQWWSTEVPAAALEAGTINVLARFTDDDKSPALVEASLGEGRIMVVTTALDVDWNNWPVEAASYLIMAQEMTRYMARSQASEGAFGVGNPIQYRLDLTEARPEARVVTPTSSGVPVRALPGEGESSTTWELSFEETRKRGFYEIELTATDGGPGDRILYAANIDPSEAQLQRIDPEALAAAVPQPALAIVGPEAPLVDLGAAKVRTEYWRWVLYALLAFLSLELLYGWWVGARR